MTNAHYIIFHPDNQRSTIDATATALIDGKLVRNWRGRIHVDKLDYGNEDPFVFTEPWLYSYCHASQLRRDTSTDNHLAKGSWLFFVSGQQANQDALAFDTVFLIGDQQPWRRVGGRLKLPEKYQHLRRTPRNPIYQKHFCWPFAAGGHTSVNYTYEADLWARGKQQYSFLPLDANMQKTVILFSELSPALAQRIKSHVRGKYPVPLTEKQAMEIHLLLEGKATIRVLRDIFLMEQRTASAQGHHYSTTC